MPREATGQVLERRRQRGRVYALRFRAYGERQYVTLGTSDDGWTRAEAEKELQNVLADVRRGIWRPPAPEPETPANADPTFHEFASEWFSRKRRELAPRTVEAYEWHLTHHLLPFFRDYRLSQITVREVDRYRDAMLAESERLRQRRERGERTEPRPLGNETINKTLVRLSQILEEAVEYELIDRNPAKGRRRRLAVPAPQRTLLDRASQIEALLAAAGKLDERARRGDVRVRRLLVATLVFTGLRIGELVALRWSDVDLASGRIKVRKSKTDAGVRLVDLVPALREDLATRRADADPEPNDLVFATSQGGPQNPTNIRTRLLAGAVKLANEAAAESGDVPLPRLTPHSLRRTFASVLYALGHDPPYVMNQMGHTNAKLALEVYARVMRRDDPEKARLKALVDGSEWAPMGTTTPTAALAESHGAAA